MSHREFEFSDRHFEIIKNFIADHAGIALTEAKRDMVYGRLVRRLRATRMADFDSYLVHLNDANNPEVVNFVNALTTNLTSFFRENHHFEFLRTQALPELERARSGSRKLRLWSAGCSTGEEPYSLAMTVLEYFDNKPGWDISIMATDLDTNVVNTARAGIYTMDRVKDLSRDRLKRWFLKGKGSNQTKVKVKAALKQPLHFMPLNLLQNWPFQEPFDIIFCRNVVIYFNKETQKGLFERFAEQCAEDGYLLIGHSESLHRVSDRFKLLGQTIHSKIY
ncbi:chemotaxis protein CheR [Ectothiorhodospiraceae bacterium BW-2]|nr:chemotaxis protein CheR [Ectothiorhodospiraceae bacterium BW-2]